MHYQCDPHSEVKLVRCVKGAIWDVIHRHQAHVTNVLRVTLIMHSTQRAFFGRKGNAVLRIVGFKRTRRKLVDAEGAGKETARVARWLELNEPSIG